MMGDKEDGHGAEGTMTREQLLTDPDEAARFVHATQLDALAIAIGTSHGAYKFTRKPTGDILAIDRIKEIHKRIPNTHLVMHGSSSVPQDLLAIIRANGGNMKETYGVPVEEIQEGIKHGVRKINIDTDIRLAMTAAIRQYFAENPEKFDPRDYLKPAMLAAKKICVQRYQEFGSRRPGVEDQAGQPDVHRRAVQEGRARPGRALTDPLAAPRVLPASGRRRRVARRRHRGRRCAAGVRDPRRSRSRRALPQLRRGGCRQLLPAVRPVDDAASADRLRVRP